MLFYSDTSTPNDIEQSERSGNLLIEGNKVYVAIAHSHYEKHHKAVISGDLIRYTLVRVKGLTVLMRDDALQAYRQNNQLYDYGILIKVADSDAGLLRLEDAKHLSIKALYVHRRKSWRDPFVHGANGR